MCLVFFRIICLFLVDHCCVFEFSVVVDHCSVFEFSVVVDWHILYNRLCSLNLWHEHCSTWQCAWVALTFRKRPWNCWHQSQFRKREGRVLRAPDQSSRRRSSHPPKVREMMAFLFFGGGKGGLQILPMYFSIFCVFLSFQQMHMEKIWKNSWEFV